MDESERQFGFVHAIPGIVILIDAIQANDVISPDECDRCCFRVAAVATICFAGDCYIVSSSTFSENAKSPSKGLNVPKSAIFRVA
ncbi:MAG: hypothetical protein IKW85_09395 [Muribaculaceae bacterium]|nr:hypothetical protein [Muribaculaceae bacterium]